MDIASTDQAQDAQGQSLADFCFNGIPEYGPDRVVRVAFRAHHRRAIEGAVERLIAILDAMEDDPDLEDGGEGEPWLGWPEAHAGRGVVGLDAGDDLEDENEHGGDILDAPHDGDDDGEPFLGWSEYQSVYGGVGSDRLEPVIAAGGKWTGEGYVAGNELLGKAGLGRVRVSPGLI